MQRVFSIKEYPYGPEELDGYMLNEAEHVFRQCEDAVDRMFDIIYHNFESNQLDTVKTELSFNPVTRTCNTTGDGYPIYLKCINDEYSSYLKMLVSDYRDNPEEILLTVNFFMFR